MRGGFKVERMYDETEEYRSECPNWLDRFAKELADKEALTAVEVARKRNNAPSIVDQMYSIMNGPAKNTQYASVEEAVQDYAQRIGLDKYRKQAIAQEIIDNSAEETPKPAAVVAEEAAKPLTIDSAITHEEAELALASTSGPIDDKEYHRIVMGIYSMGDNWFENIVGNVIKKSEDKPITPLHEKLLKAFEDVNNKITNTISLVNYDKCDNAAALLEKKNQIHSYVEKKYPALYKYLVKDSWRYDGLYTESSGSEKKKIIASERPKLLDSNPAIDSYINNVVDTNYSAQLPAILYNIGVNFARDGVSDADLDDPDLARYINNLIIEKRKHLHNNDEHNLGKYLGVAHEDAGMVDNPWQGLMPAPRR